MLIVIAFAIESFNHRSLQLNHSITVAELSDSIIHSISDYFIIFMLVLDLFSVLLAVVLQITFTFIRYSYRYQARPLTLMSPITLSPGCDILPHSNVPCWGSCPSTHRVPQGFFFSILSLSVQEEVILSVQEEGILLFIKDFNTTESSALYKDNFCTVNICTCL